MENRQPTRAEVVALLGKARHELDNLRQLDNMVLYALSNPVELDEARGKILASMRAITGSIQEIERVLAQMDGRK